MTLPIPNLDDKTFDQLIQEARKLIPLHAQEWTDHNLHDPGITFLELFAWLTEMQFYQLNRISERHYHKYLKLLGIQPNPAKAARVHVTFSGSGVVPQGCLLVARDPATNEQVFFETESALQVVDAKIRQLIVRANFEYKDITSFNEPNRNFFYAFGENAGDDSCLFIGLDFEPPAISAGGLLNLYIKIFEDDLLIPVGSHGDEPDALIPSVDVQWSCMNGDIDGQDPWIPLEFQGDDLVRRFYRAGIATIALSPGMKKNYLPDYPKKEEYFCYWIRCQVKTGGIKDSFYEIPPRVERILLNTVSATEGKTVVHEYPKKHVSSLPDLTLEIPHMPILYRSMKIQGWEERDDLDASGPEYRHFRVDYEKGLLIFGNGLHGMMPPDDEPIGITYRSCSGRNGNVPARAIQEIQDARPGLSVLNHFPACGGQDAEPLGEAKARARQEMKTPFMAVTAEDYENIARSTPGLRVARAKALNDPGVNKVMVVVVPFSLRDNPVPSHGFMKAVKRHLDIHRLITTYVEVRAPSFTLVSVSATVRMKTGYNADQVRKRCEDNLKGLLCPIQRNAEDNEWSFGRPVCRSDVYECLEGVDGVDGITSLSLHASGNGFLRFAQGDVIIDPSSLVNSGHHIIDIVGGGFDPCRGKGNCEDEGEGKDE